MQIEKDDGGREEVKASKGRRKEKDENDEGGERKKDVCANKYFKEEGRWQ